jgi:hypothetical protein
MVKFRIDPATASLMERAYHYVEMNKSQFVRLSVREKAKAILAYHEETCFSVEDWDRCKWLSEVFLICMGYRQSRRCRPDIPRSNGSRIPP